jgi:hypothetical protein
MPYDDKTPVTYGFIAKVMGVVLIVVSIVSLSVSQADKVSALEVQADATNQKLQTTTDELAAHDKTLAIINTKLDGIIQRLDELKEQVARNRLR